MELLYLYLYCVFSRSFILIDLYALIIIILKRTNYGAQRFLLVTTFNFLRNVYGGEGTFSCNALTK